MLYENTLECGRYSLAIDPELPITDDSLQVEVPYYPDEKDVVQLKDKQLYLVHTIQEDTFTGCRLKRIGGSNARYKVTAATQNIPIQNINHKIQHTINANSFHIEE